uniref:Uncharacterized protein n=1 Tax=Oryza nivara TaxID=4536 RepID=A0A0E0G9Z2_ORYNI
MATSTLFSSSPGDRVFSPVRYAVPSSSRTNRCPCGQHRRWQRRAELLLELGDLGEHRGLGVELGRAVGEGALHKHVPELLHQRVVGAARVVGVREHGFAVDLLEKILLAEASGVETAGGARAQSLPGHCHDAALDGALDVLLDVPQVDGLAEGDQERGGHELQDVDCLGGLPGGDESKRVDVLVVLLGALDVVGHWVAQELQLGAVGGHGDLGALEPVVQARVAAAGQVGGQPVVVELVHELGELREHELADVGDGETGVVHGHTDGGALEVAAVERLAAVDVDHRVVVHGVDLTLDGLGGGTDNLNLRAEPLWGCPERVPVLLRLHQWVELTKLLGMLHVGASLQDVLHDGGGLDLSWMVLELVSQVVGVLRLAVHHLAEHGREDLGEDGKNVSLKEHGRCKARAHGSAIDHGKAFLGLQLEEAALDASNLERLSGVHLAAIWCNRHGVLAPSDKAGNVGQRDEVTGGGDRAPERQARCDVRVEQLGDRLEDLEPDAGVSLEECVDADEHCRAGCLRRQNMTVGASAERAGIEESAEKTSKFIIKKASKEFAQ